MNAVNPNTVEDYIRKIISSYISEARVQDITRVPSAGYLDTYVATMTNNAQVAFSLSRRIRHIRSEQGPLRAEAAFLQWLEFLYNETISEDVNNIEDHAVHADTDGLPDVRHQVRCIWKYVPKLLEHNLEFMPDPTPYTITTAQIGQTIVTLEPGLTFTERKSVDFQIGQLLRRISLLPSPTNRFGFGESIVPPIQTRSIPRRQEAVVEMTRTSYPRWSEFFTHLLQNATRDAEALGINIPITSIERCMKRFSKILDIGVEPSLVIFDAGLDKNVLVRRVPATTEKSSRKRRIIQPQLPGKGSRSKNDPTSDITKTSEFTIEVTGLREWSNVIFGDPLFAYAFSNEPSPELVNGFNAQIRDLEPGVLDCIGSPVKDTTYAATRLVLYQMYHAAAGVVREFISREPKAYERELENRKKLMIAVRHMDTLKDIVLPTRERMFTAQSSAKRARMDTGYSRGR
ncbi:hypothetical protein VHEMI09008 [[Torrubiella] hemipterigena]|uniref:Uncharacterized protein n=1 Tax=[Torrubiella] hemipterigena TaxID=1531966 RepID=A0A0A1T8H9_9HYPO|nr:hypothetical protein VHEMI09008 [[Torrubiella] hemipterigena]